MNPPVTGGKGDDAGGSVVRLFIIQCPSLNITCLAMLGNDDLLAVDALFEKVCGEFGNVHNIAGRIPKIHFPDYTISQDNFQCIILFFPENIPYCSIRTSSLPQQGISHFSHE